VYKKEEAADMSKDIDEATGGEEGERGILSAKPVTRRDFLKIAGIAGATIGAGAGLVAA
jgi:hypothetical protein